MEGGREPVKRVRVGLLGCGRVAQSVHLPLLTQLPAAELVALAEVDPGRRAAAQRLAPAARAFADYHDLLDLAELDAVVVCLPSALHASAAQATLGRGLPLYLEKPLATRLEDGARVVEAWRRAQAPAMIGFNLRFNPLYREARRLLARERLGPLVCARSVFASTAARSRAPAEGGVLLDLGSHHVDLARWLLGREVAAVSAEGTDASAVLQMRLSDGTLAQTFVSNAAVEEDRFEVYGRGGKLTVDRYLALAVELSAPTRARARLRRVLHTARALTRAPYLLAKLRAPANEPSYPAALAHFLAAVRARHPAAPDLWDGLRSLAVIDAAETSARLGRAVEVSPLAPTPLGA